MMVIDFSVYVRKSVFGLDVFGILSLPQKKAILGGMLSLALFLCGCQSNQISKQKMYTFRAKGVTVLKKADDPFGTHPCDYARVIEATGRGMPANNAMSESEKRYTATEAAKYRALAKLTEKINGANVNLRREVRDMLFSSEVIEVHIEGQLKGVSLVSTKYDADTGVAHVTLRVGLDSQGEPVEVNYATMVSRSKTARKIQAESAARTIALGKLMEQVGNMRVDQTVKVQDFMFSSQKAWQDVQGMLEGVEYSKPHWSDERTVTVEATLKVTRKQLDKLSTATKEEIKN